MENLKENSNENLIENFNENSKENFKDLSPSETNILENKEKIIKLNETENEEEIIDLTEELLNLTKNFKLGEMIHTEDFTLEETMNAVELNHFKMDAHQNYHEANTFTKLFREGKIKKMEELNLEETLSLIDNLFIKEMMWLYGSPIYQTIFNLVYFTEESINNKEKSDNILFRIFLDSSLHLIYIIYTRIVECGCLREEDLMMIPVQNAQELKREKVLDELKSYESELKNKIKNSENNRKKKINMNLLNRIKIRIEFLNLIIEQFNTDENTRYENLNMNVNKLKNLISDIKPEENNCELTQIYFDDKLCRIAPAIASIKLVNNYSFEQALKNFDKILNNLTNVSKIYEMKYFPQILKSIQDIIKENCSFIIRSILEYNIFPKGNVQLLGKFEYANLINKNFTDLKINIIDENSELMSNLVNVHKELLLKNLKNRTRQVRDASSLFEGLSYLVLEGNQIDKELKKNNTNKKPVLTNFFLRQVLQEMITQIWTQFELELFGGFELDYVFYASQNIIEHLCTSTQIVASSFAEKILKEQDFVKSQSKKKLENSQKTILDEIHILNGLRSALKGITLICRYLKLSGIIKSPKIDENLNISNRFPNFKNTKYFIDLSYETFIKHTYFDVEKEKDMIFQSADSYLKQSLKFFSELKSADVKLRDAVNYPNTYLDDLSKAVICNNLLLSKIKKLDKKGMRLSYTTKKYDTFLPILELN